MIIQLLNKVKREEVGKERGREMEITKKSRKDRVNDLNNVNEQTMDIEREYIGIEDTRVDVNTARETPGGYEWNGKDVLTERKDNTEFCLGRKVDRSNIVERQGGKSEKLNKVGKETKKGRMTNGKVEKSDRVNTADRIERLGRKSVGRINNVRRVDKKGRVNIKDELQILRGKRRIEGLRRGKGNRVNAKREENTRKEKLEGGRVSRIYEDEVKQDRKRKEELRVRKVRFVRKRGALRTKEEDLQGHGTRNMNERGVFKESQQARGGGGGEDGVKRKRDSLLLLLLISSLPLSTYAQTEYATTAESVDEDVENVSVVVSFNATLPCNVKAPTHDAPTLTLWYIEDGEAPVYSYDERPGLRGSQWADTSVLGSRAFYHAHGSPPALLLHRVNLGDARLYRCRVDFQNTRSRVAWVNLTVIVPPRKIEVVPRVSPVKLGKKNDVVCRAFGGHPAPQVIWLQGNREVDATYTQTDGDETYNVLEVEATRGDITLPFVCRATNNDRVGPDEVQYLRNVTCGPLKVEISGEDEPMSEGRSAKLTCTVVGSNPSPLVTWFDQGEMVTPLHTMVTHRDNITRSLLTVDVTREDHLRQLVCRAVNKLLPGDVVEDIFTLDVQYKPRLQLTLGRSLDADDLQETNDLFFDCNIDANPDPYKVEWFHNGEVISHNISGGVIVSDSTLALQKVKRERSGVYQCSASNVEGDTTSPPVNITIKYTPRCAVSPSLRGVGLLEGLNVTCQVDADPPDVSFSWTFNNSVRREQSKTIGSNRYSTEGLKSVLLYTPVSERDYGTLLCYASNSVGTQLAPCSFTVISAGAPEEVSGCTVDNITSHSASIACTPGFNGGLPQQFLIQVWLEKEDPETGHTSRGPLVVNTTTTLGPELVVRSLQPGHRYRVHITAHNPRGSAPPVPVYIHTMKEAEMHKSLPSRSEPSPLMLVLAVIGGALLVVVVLLVGVWAVRGSRRRQHAHRDNLTMSIKETNPDIIETGPTQSTSSSPPPISISVIKQPPHTVYEPPPQPPLAPPDEVGLEGGLGIGGGGALGGLRATTLPNQKTSFGLSEPLHRPIEKSLQTPARHPYDDDPSSSSEVSPGTQLASVCIDLGPRAAQEKDPRTAPYPKSYHDRDSGTSVVRKPLLLGGAESVM